MTTLPAGMKKAGSDLHLLRLIRLVTFIGLPKPFIGHNAGPAS